MNSDLAPQPDSAVEILTGSELERDLRQHLALCEEILALVEKENQVLREGRDSAHFELHHTKKNLLPKLNLSLDKIRKHRIGWQRLNGAERAQHAEIPPLLRQNQDLVMKIIFLDRENEQVLLRRGLVPTPHLPPANRQRPHFVADLYRRGGGAPA